MLQREQTACPGPEPQGQLVQQPELLELPLAAEPGLAPELMPTPMPKHLPQPTPGQLPQPIEGQLQLVGPMALLVEAMMAQLPPPPRPKLAAMASTR